MNKGIIIPFAFPALQLPDLPPALRGSFPTSNALNLKHDKYR
jgi:hypothetical protein